MKIKQLIFALIFLIVSLYIDFISGNYLSKSVDNYPMMLDLLYKIIPFYDVAKLTEAIIILSVILGIYLLFKYHKLDSLHHYVIMIGIFQCIRAFLIWLNPVMPQQSCNGFFESVTYAGMFPSGHISIPFFMFLFSYGINKKWSYLFLILTILVGIGLLMSRSHYTADLFATIFVVYSIVSVYENWNNFKC